MRLIMVDHIDALEPWRKITGRKAVSLEEAYLLERFGSPGYLPETLLIETMSQFCRWLVMVSSDFDRGTILSGFERTRIANRPRMGDVVNISAEAVSRDDDSITCDVVAAVNDAEAACGRLSFDMVSLAELMPPEEARILWRQNRK